VVKIKTFYKNYLLLISLLLLMSVFAIHLSFAKALASDKEYQRIVIIGDPHLPGENITGKENLVKDINSWSDVDVVVAIGDICEDTGSRDEYSYAKQFFSKVVKPVSFIVGNHDYIYADLKSSRGKRIKGSPGTREAALQLFKQTFGLPSVYYSKKVGKYLLVFLSPDDLQSNYLTMISDTQLSWLQKELSGNREVPTIIFFHAPLKGTLQDYNENVNKENFIAQPYEKIRDIIMANQQIFMWISGHTHTPATNKSFSSPINIYENQVTNIHNPDINRKTLWTNSLYLYPDKTVVKTYNHTKGAWLTGLERVVIPRQK